MIALDTNVLVRFLVEDDAEQTAKVSQYTRALAAFVVGKGDFADYVIREHGLAVGCTVVATFDRALLKETGLPLPVKESMDAGEAPRERVATRSAAPPGAR